MKVKVIAKTEIRYNGKTWGPMPEGSTGREGAYVFELPLDAARALVKRGHCQPAYGWDEKQLLTAGVTCRSAFGKAPKSTGKKKAKPAPAPAPEKRDSGVDIASALEGTKSEMKAACEALGLDTGGTKSELRSRLEEAK
jgi:hypothetical protein